MEGAWRASGGRVEGAWRARGGCVGGFAFRPGVRDGEARRAWEVKGRRRRVVLGTISLGLSLACDSLFVIVDAVQVDVSVT